MQGGTFTWSNSREVALKARLDRFLFSADWEDEFPIVCQRRMSRLCSDHFPIFEVDLFREGVCRLDSRICGLRMKVLWIGFDLGGTPIRFMVHRVLFWLIN